jgi:phosphatidylethanolamine/phosphatidyl-N-methylethanolamine N-methyltransferase
MFNADAGIFIKQWFRNPKEAGALSPSGDALARAMARLVNSDENASVVELGGGTGPITQALLQNGIAPQRLTVMEKNSFMAHALRQNFSSVRVVEQDAARPWKIGFNEHGDTFKSVVSGLPMLLLGARKQYAILKYAFALMESDGAFLQFTYGLSSPVSRRVLERLGLEGERVEFVWRNAPPASVWRFRKSRQDAVISQFNLDRTMKRQNRMHISL